MAGSSPPAPTPDEVFDAYDATRRRIDGLVRGAPAGVGDAPVPATPGWTVAGVISHLAGVAEDLLAGNLEGVTTEPWTSAQVERHRGRPVDDVLDTWADAGSQMVDQLRALGLADPVMVFDAVSHEHDLRIALGDAAHRDSEAVAIGSWYGARSLAKGVARAGLPLLRVRDTGGREWIGGDGEPAATLTASPYDLLRSTSGRRTVEQLAGLDWDGADPTTWLPSFTFGPFTPPAAPVE